MTAPAPKKAAFVLCARNCAPALPRVLANVTRMASLFPDSAVLFLENDSRDATARIIAQWCAGRPGARLVTVEGLRGLPVRTLCLETVRNRGLSALAQDYTDCDTLFVMDCDEVNSGDIDLDAVRRAVTFLHEDEKRAGVFANTLGTYFDMWALRHPTLCPGDAWEEVFDHVIAHGGSDEAAYRATLARRVLSLKPDAPPLAVDSAFGGLGIYKMASVLANPGRYAGAKTKLVPAHVAGITGANAAELGWQVCEHVAFHQGLRARGESLFVLPFLINCQSQESEFPASAWRSFLFDPRLMNPGAAHDAAATRRNQPCSCGSGRRYKHCHGRMG